MEPWNSPAFEKESPSQENIAHVQLIKRDGESLEDFEDITKDEPSMKDMTAQFLQYETGDKSTYQKEEVAFPDDDKFDFEQKRSDHLDSAGMNQTSKDFDIFEPTQLSKVSDHQDPFIDFEQTDFQNKPDAAGEPARGNPVMNILEENKLIDIASNDEISTGSDDLSFVPKKGESSPTLFSELDRDTKNLSLGSRTTEFPTNSQTPAKFPSESHLTAEDEHEILKGEGIHIKETVGDFLENDEEVIPEPIPKDYPEIGAIEGKEFLAAFGLDTWFHPHLLHPKVESLIYWRDPKKSGIVFGAILIILLSLTSFSLISVVAYTSLTALIVALAFRIYKSVMQAVQKTSEGHPFKITASLFSSGLVFTPYLLWVSLIFFRKYFVAVLNHPIVTAVFNSIEEYLDIDLTVNPDKAREVSDVVITHVNKALTECRRLFLIEDVIDSIKFGVLLWSLTYIGAWFNGLSLLIIAFVGLFTLPKVYENNKTQIDANIDVVKTKINEVTEKITAVIPLGKKTEESKEKGE